MKLASINIEMRKHLQEFQAFLKAQQPDVLCLQELAEPDIGLFEDMFGQKMLFVPTTIHPIEGGPGQGEDAVMGIALIARAPLQNTSVAYYSGTPDNLKTIRFYQEDGELRVDPSTIHNQLITATVGGMRIGTTHFTWSPNGQSTALQMQDVGKLIALAKAEAAQHNGLVFCGDFNAPRGRTTFGRIAAEFTDAIPAHYTGSIDGTFHRAGNLPYMVDGLFHTPNYKAEDVTLHTGISDHMAITATLTRV
jgi:exonuclease III